MNESGVCSMLGRGVAAILGPQSAFTSPHIGSLCDSFDIPHIETRWDYRRRVKDYSINLYPHWETLSAAYKELVLAKQWKSFTVLFEEDEALIRLQKLLQVTTDKKVKINVLKLQPEYRVVLKELKKKAITNIVLDCKTSNIKKVLKQAQQVGIMTDYHSYVIISLDLDTVDMEEFRHGGTNITAFQLVDPDSPHVRRAVMEWTFDGSSGSRLRNPNSLGNFQTKEIKIDTQTALIYDAVTLLSKSLHDLDRSQDMQVKPISCDNGSPWAYGNSLINYMKMSSVEGLTGTVSFDRDGFRSDFKLNIIELTRKGIKKMSSDNGRRHTNSFSITADNLSNKITFNETGSVVDAQRSGWPKTTCTEDSSTILYVNQWYKVLKIHQDGAV
ncbi:Glutamate receptor ionotropic, kainate 1 [Nymphon striatum]|nr:Glutamate receptor ionotropic, kainate 1 [Nymphon striatum]